jgi:hypothetical protein
MTIAAATENTGAETATDVTINDNQEDENMQMPAIKKRKGSLDQGALRAASATLTRLSGLQVDVKKLDENDRIRAVELYRKLTNTNDGKGDVNVLRLSRRETADLAALVAVAAGKESGFFDDQRKEESLRQKARDAALQALTPAPRPRMDEQGSLWFPQRLLTLLEFQAQTPFQAVVPIGDWGVLYVLCAIFANPSSAPVLLGGRARIVEAAGEPTIVADTGFPLFASGLDPDGRVRWEESIDNLSRNSFFEVERSGRQITIRKGRLARSIVDRAKMPAIKVPVPS